MHIAVVIAARDMAAWIGVCLWSLLAQTHHNWRAIVVDDGSGDDTGAVVSRFFDPRIRLVTQPPSGVSAARNHALALSDGDAVLFLDADDWLAPDALARLAAALAADDGAAAAYGPYAVMPADARPGDPPKRVKHPRLPAGNPLPALLVGNRFANGGHVLVRRDAAERAAPFDTGLSFGEDWEYWVHLALADRFTGVSGRAPLLFVRRRPAGAYASRAADLTAFMAPTAAIFAEPLLRSRFSAARLGRLRRAADAEAEWIAGRARLDAGDSTTGLPLLRRSAWHAPSLRRAVLLAALHARHAASIAAASPRSPRRAVGAG
jgi:glycosyltransferase involved in cell wall biosynthesis